MSNEIVETIVEELDVIEHTHEYNEYMDARKAYEDATGAVGLLDGVDVMDNKLITSLENRVPGVVTNNLPVELWYSTEAVEATVDNLEMKASQASMLAARATMALVTKFQDFTRAIRKSSVDDGVGVALHRLQTDISKLTLSSDEKKVKNRLPAYKKLMGVPPENEEQVAQMFEKFKEYKNPIQVLKDFPNTRWDKLFTPLLASTVSETGNVFRCFEELNNNHAVKIINNMNEVVAELDDIVSKNDHARMARFNKKIIPDDAMKMMTDLISSLDVELDHRRPVLSQSRLITKAVAKQLKVNEESLRKKATVVNAIAYRFEDLDKAYTNVLEATDKLSSFNKQEQGKDTKNKLKEFRYATPLKVAAKQAAAGNFSKSADTHKRVLDELDDLWNLVGILTRMSISYITMYSILTKTIEMFRIACTDFAKDVADIGEAKPPVTETDVDASIESKDNKDADTDEDSDDHDEESHAEINDGNESDDDDENTTSRVSAVPWIGRYDEARIAKHQKKHRQKMNKSLI